MAPAAIALTGAFAPIRGRGQCPGRGVVDRARRCILYDDEILSELWSLHQALNSEAGSGDGGGDDEVADDSAGNLDEASTQAQAASTAWSSRLSARKDPSPPPRRWRSQASAIWS